MYQKDMLQQFANIAQLVIAAASITALFFTVRELRETRKHQRENTQVSRGQIVTDILVSIWSDEAERTFFYRLDYEDWRFSSDRFRKTSEERVLDQILYKLSHIGSLIKMGSIGYDDARLIEFTTLAVIGNAEVQAYLAWVKEDAPLGSSFDDAIGLYLLFCKYKAERAQKTGLPEIEKLATQAYETVKSKLVRRDFDQWWEKTAAK